MMCLWVMLWIPVNIKIYPLSKYCERMVKLFLILMFTLPACGLFYWTEGRKTLTAFIVYLLFFVWIFVCVPKYNN